MAQLHPKPYSFESEGPASSEDREDVELARLAAIAEKLPEGAVVGGLVRFQVADGYAQYLVVKEKPLTLQHIPFWDGYSVSAALIRGLRRADVEQMLNHERALRAMFSKKKK